MSDEEAEQEMVSTRVEPELKRQFRVAAARRDLAMSELLGEIVEEWVRDEADVSLEDGEASDDQPSDAPADD